MLRIVKCKNRESSVNNKQENAKVSKLDTGNLFSATPKKSRDFEPGTAFRCASFQAERAVRPEPEREQPVLRAVSISRIPRQRPLREALDKPAEDTNRQKQTTRRTENRNSGFALRRRSWRQRVEQERKRRKPKVVKAEKAAQRKTVSPTIAAGPQRQTLGRTSDEQAPIPYKFTVNGHAAFGRAVSAKCWPKSRNGLGAKTLSGH